ncbi:hypothetical protein C8F04DRAFT_1154963 [Mycena alexandri]|uniref:Uncharacterized protein n=1 Tax=Mycena alexandri TaxID=1745969 RepID=A0AAD6S0J5_9AGAR|nr:hypothetical protein C8F04DRAFT_1154963 [Mycena alexandri]
MFRPRSNTKTFGAIFRQPPSLPMRRPRRLWDMHLPKTTWDYCPREIEPRHCTPGRLLERTGNWVSIPDANLPEPWTCNWATVEWTAEVRPLEATLASQYALCSEPLTPVMCNPPRIHCFTFSGSGLQYQQERAFSLHLKRHKVESEKRKREK